MAQGLLSRFEQKVQRSPDCWTWTGELNNSGYGRIWFWGKKVSAHRLSYELFVGPIEAGLQVLHRCDNPRCVRPDHLFLGTNADNMEDKMAKGRARGGSGKSLPGEANGRARLSREQVRQLRTSYAQGGTSHSLLAKEYGVHPSTIGAILNGRLWSD